MNIKDQKIITQSEWEEQLRRYGMQWDCVLKRSWVLMAIAGLNAWLLWKFTAGWEQSMLHSIMIAGMWMASQSYGLDHRKWMNNQDVKSMLILVGVFGLVGSLLIGLIVTDQSAIHNTWKEHQKIAGGQAQLMLAFIGMAISSVIHREKWNKKKKSIKAMSQEHCAEVLKWMQEDQDVENYVNAIKKEGRPIMNMEYFLIKQWMDEKSLRENKEKDRQACLKLYS